MGCQWESPEEDRREVACQSDSAETRDAAVQVDLLTQQLSGSSAVLLQCLAVRPDGPDGGALLQHCTGSRTRTRPIQPAAKCQVTLQISPDAPDAPEPPQSRSRTRRRPAPISERDEQQNLTSSRRRAAARRRKRRRRQEEDNDEEDEEEEEEGEELDTGDPTWTTAAGGVTSNLPPFSQNTQQDSESQSAPVRAVKLELDSTMCDVCGKVMKNKASLARHSFIHTGMKPYACHLCELRFNRRDNLQYHLNRLHPNGVTKLEKQRDVQAWLCAVCGKTFNCRSRLKTHEVIHSGVKPFGCDLCPKAYMRANDLEHHKKIVHVNGATEPQRPSSLLCDFCGKEFKCRSQLAIHFQTHTGERPHLCDICGRKFARQYQLKRHKILVHVNQVIGEDNPLPDAPFTCAVCGKRMKSEALLAAHSRIHTGDKPFRCSLCLCSFQRAACLKQHHARIHLKIKANDKPNVAGRKKSTMVAKAFPCPICGKVFKFRSLLASHSIIHSDMRPYACEFCSRSFRRLSHLKRHREVVHANGARPPQSFICHICGKDKKCRSQLARHVIIHTGERPYACDLCCARFNRTGNLKQHKKRMHGVGKQPEDETLPILFDDIEGVDMTPALTYKQEETVVSIDTAADVFEVTICDDPDANAAEHLIST